MKQDIEKVLIDSGRIDRRVRELAGQIVSDLRREFREPVELTVIPILTGAMIFAADLLRQLPFRMKIGLLTVSSYPGVSIRSQGAQLVSEKLGDLAGRHVLLVDDILDSGQTISRVRDELLSRKCASVKTCVLLRKPTAGASQTPVDYVGFDIPDEFVVGYGLDYNDYYRNLPDIVTLKPGVFQ
jgi:hypoxanthine phosphoribosyltransferase